MEKLKLAVSNVAWYHGELDSFLRLLSSLSCQGVELAASMLWDEPVKASRQERRELRHKIKDAGLKLTGLQALLFSRKDLSLFKDASTRNKTLDYLAKLIELCSDLGGEVLVFGSPANRNIGRLSFEQAYAIAIDFFGRVSKLAHERKLYFCIEPLGRSETDFINTVAAAEKLIADISDSRGLGLHIDTKGLIEEGEVSAPYLTESFSQAKHIHLNDPGLLPPGSTGYDHKIIRDKMSGSNYSRFVSIEMRRLEPDVSGAIRKAVAYVRRAYF